MRLALSGLTALAWFIIAYKVFGFRFETNDDAGIANIAAGAFGEDSQYLIHVNIVIGWGLKLLNFLVPGFAWYTSASYLLLLFAFSAVGFILVEKFGFSSGGAVYLLLLITVGTDLFCRFQYTKNAAFLITSGLLLVIRRFGEMKTSFWLGTTLCLFGSMLRFDLLFPVLAVSFFVFLHLFWNLSKPDRIKAAGSLLLIAAIGSTAFGINRIAYKSDPGWDYFYRFNEARESLFDYKLQFMGPAHEYYDIGVREPESALLKSWDIYDPEFFTTEKLNEMSAMIDREALLLSAFRFPTAFVSLLFGNVYVIILLFSVALVLFERNRKKAFTALLIVAVVIAGLFSLYWLGRMIERVQTSLTLSAALFILVLADYSHIKKRKRYTVVPLVGAALAISMVFLIPLKQNNDYYLGSRLPTVSDFDAVRNDSAHLYILSTEHFDKAMGYDVFSPRPPGYFKNMVFLGGWLINSPYEGKTLESFGAQNPFRDVVNNETLLLFESTMKHEINRYINIRYDITARLVEYSDGVYRIISEER